MGMTDNEGTLPMAAAGGHTAKREAREFLLERLEARTGEIRRPHRGGKNWQPFWQSSPHTWATGAR
jgi:hypothetical protein